MATEQSSTTDRDALKAEYDHLRQLADEINYRYEERRYRIFQDANENLNEARRLRLKDLGDTPQRIKIIEELLGYKPEEGINS